MELPPKFHRVHLVFHVSLQKHYHDGGDRVAPLEPIIGRSGEMYFQVSKIMDHRWRYGRFQYLTRFTGYDPSHDEQLSDDQLEDATKKLRSYRDVSGLNSDDSE